MEVAPYIYLGNAESWANSMVRPFALAFQQHGWRRRRAVNTTMPWLAEEHISILS